jgi:hypothetical protein
MAIADDTWPECLPLEFHWLSGGKHKNSLFSSLLLLPIIALGIRLFFNFKNIFLKFKFYFKLIFLNWFNLTGIGNNFLKYKNYFNIFLIKKTLKYNFYQTPLCSWSLNISYVLVLENHNLIFTLYLSIYILVGIVDYYPVYFYI